METIMTMSCQDLVGGGGAQDFLGLFGDRHSSSYVCGQHPTTRHAFIYASRACYNDYVF
jgi:hypothetical protein